MLFKSSVHACTFKETSLSLSCLVIAILLALEILASLKRKKTFNAFAAINLCADFAIHPFRFFFELFFVCLLPLFLGFAMKLLSAASLVSLLL